MPALRQKLIDELGLRGSSLNTKLSCVGADFRLARHFKRSPEQITDAELKQFHTACSCPETPGRISLQRWLGAAWRWAVSPRVWPAFSCAWCNLPSSAMAPHHRCVTVGGRATHSRRGVRSDGCGLGCSPGGPLIPRSPSLPSVPIRLTSSTLEKRKTVCRRIPSPR